MKKTTYIAAIVALLAIGTFILWPRATKAPEQPVLAKAITKPATTHAQETWLSALEWCESRGKETAVNPEDRDGTPSYYSYQFKPSTFRGYGEQYGVIPKGLTDTELMDKLKDYQLQRAIVAGMITDTTVKWEQQFPDCVRKIGRPPRY